jgi:hypothetical protein
LLQLVRRVGETGCGYRLILFGFLSQSSKTKAMAAMPSVAHPRTAEPGDTPVGSGELAQVKDQGVPRMRKGLYVGRVLEAVLCEG